MTHKSDTEMQKKRKIGRIDVAYLTKKCYTELSVCQ